jgi:hypothetical protein
MNHRYRTPARNRQRHHRLRPAISAITLIVAAAAVLAGWPAAALATVCRDGWVSGSVEPGTCSHHGGIYHGSPVTADGVTWLKDTAVTLAITSHGQHFVCQGGIMGQRAGTVYVVTAKHCLTPMTGAGPIQVRTFDGIDGYATHWVGAYDADVALLWVTFPHTSVQWNDVCVTCLGSVPSSGVEILSVLSSHGGKPVLSTGTVVSTDGLPWWTVDLPSARGTSGALVVTRDGAFVGVVSQAVLVPGTDASADVRIVPGPVVQAFLTIQMQTANVVKPPSGATVHQPVTVKDPSFWSIPAGDLTGRVSAIDVGPPSGYWKLTLSTPQGHVLVLWGEGPCLRQFSPGDQMSLLITSGGWAETAPYRCEMNEVESYTR